MRRLLPLLVLVVGCSHTHPGVHVHAPHEPDPSPASAVCAVDHDHDAWEKLWEERDVVAPYEFDEDGNWSWYDGCNYHSGRAGESWGTITAMYCPGPPNFCQNDDDEWGSCRDHRYHREPESKWR